MEGCKEEQNDFCEIEYCEVEYENENYCCDGQCIKCRKHIICFCYLIPYRHTTAEH